MGQELCDLGARIDAVSDFPSPGPESQAPPPSETCETSSKVACEDPRVLGRAPHDPILQPGAQTHSNVPSSRLSKPLQASLIHFQEVLDVIRMMLSEPHGYFVGQGLDSKRPLPSRLFQHKRLKNRSVRALLGLETQPRALSSKQPWPDRGYKGKLERSLLPPLFGKRISSCRL